MFLRQIAIRKMAVDMAIPEKTIELVLKYTFDEARKAFHEHASIEISGFGKFLLDERRIRGQRRKIAMGLEKWNKQLVDPESSPAMIKNRLLFIQKVESDLALINKLTHEV